jgi:glycosyltransferase involved in cell wall biosynthesis
VICSDIGGMAEKVADGVNGLHFRVGDADSLAETLRRAASEKGLWAQLQGNVPPIHAMATHVSRLGDLYRSLLAGRAPADAPREDPQVVQIA